MSVPQKKLKICLVTDWFTNIGGGEKVVKAISQAFPKSPLLTTVFDPKITQLFLPKDTKVIGSWLQKIPKSYTKHQWLLPFLNGAIESLDTSEYDVILSFSSCVAKNVKKKRADQVHICYIHTPVRYGWDLSYDHRVKNLPFGIRFLAQKYLEYFKNKDYKTRNNPDFYIANSSETASRVKKYYQRKSDICYPPFDPAEIHFSKKKSDFYLGFGRMVPYKRFDLLVEAFLQMPEKKLILAGEGPEKKSLERLVLSRGAGNITFLGRVSDQKKKELFGQARAFLLPQKEDAGITQLESMASGTPVIAFRAGGVLDVLVEGVNGLFFEEQKAGDLVKKIKYFETVASDFNPQKIRKSVAAYNLKNFQKKYLGFVDKFLSSK